MNFFSTLPLGIVYKPDVSSLARSIFIELRAANAMQQVNIAVDGNSLFYDGWVIIYYQRGPFDSINEFYLSTHQY